MWSDADTRDVHPMHTCTCVCCVQMLDAAEELETISPLAKFQKANVYLSLGQVHEALQETQVALDLFIDLACVMLYYAHCRKRRSPWIYLEILRV